MQVYREESGNELEQILAPAFCVTALFSGNCFFVTFFWLGRITRLAENTIRIASCKNNRRIIVQQIPTFFFYNQFLFHNFLSYISCVLSIRICVAISSQITFLLDVLYLAKKHKWIKLVIVRKLKVRNSRRACNDAGQWRSIYARSNSIKTHNDPIRRSSRDGY